MSQNDTKPYHKKNNNIIIAIRELKCLTFVIRLACEQAEDIAFRLCESQLGSYWRLNVALCELQEFKDCEKPQNEHHKQRQKTTSCIVTFSMERNYLFIREVSFLIGRGGLWKFFKFCEFLVIPPTVWVKFFWSLPEVLQNLSDPPPPPNLIIKVAELVFVFEAEIDHPLGLLKVKALGREFKRNFNSCSNKTTKFASYQYLLHDW